MTTVNDPAAEREPDHVTPEPYLTAAEAAELRALFAGNPVIDHAESALRAFGVVDGESADAVKLLLAWPDFNLLTEREVRGVAARFVPAPADVRHFAALADAYTVCGLERATVRWTDDPETPVDCPACTAPTPEPELDDEDDLVPAPGCGHPMPQGVDCCISTRTPAPAQPERRTVSLEVLADELRAAGNAVFAARAAEFGDEPQTLPAAATVAVVIRIAGTGALEEVFDTDATWRQLSGHDNPMVVLRDLLQVVVGLHGGGLVGIPAAELLMPTPDVLAALDGRPDAQFWTAPVPVRAEDIEEGWIAYGYSGPGTEEPITTKNKKCKDPACPWPGDCTALTIGAEEKPQHFADWTLLDVRIPASVTR